MKDGFMVVLARAARSWYHGRAAARDIEADRRDSAQKHPLLVALNPNVDTH